MRPGRVLAALIAADTAFAFQQTAVIPAIPVVEHALDVSQEWSAWLLSGYLLVASAATPLLGRLADRYGRRRMLLIALVVFLAGSVGAAVSPSLVPLVVCRAVQGVGGAVFPISFAITRDRLPPRRVSSAIGLLTGAFGVGTALGVGLGGWLAEAVSWRLVFIVGAVVIGLATLLVLGLVPGYGEVVEPGRVDVVGAALLGGTLAAALLPLTLGARLGWSDPVVVSLFVVTVLLAALWARHELRVDEPIVELRTLRDPAVGWANLATFAMGYALFGGYFLIPHLVKNDDYGYAASAAMAGLYLLPSAIGQLIIGPVAGAAVRRRSPKWFLLAGMLTIAVCTLLLGVPRLPPAGFLAVVFVLGCGVGAVVSTASTLVTQRVAAEHTGVSTALNTTMRRFGGGFGGQISAGLLVMLTAGGAPSRGAFTVGFLIATVLCTLGAAAAALIPPHLSG